MGHMEAGFPECMGVPITKLTMKLSMVLVILLALLDCYKVYSATCKEF